MAEAPSAALTFGRDRRIKAGGDFGRARKNGQRIACGCLILNWLRCPENEATRLGVITPRTVGSAVVRSRARRLLRESFRLHQHEIGETIDLILVARRSIDGKSFREVEEDFLAAARKARLLRMPLK